MTNYPIIANCNFESRDDDEGKDIHAARKAVDAGLTDDADLIGALEALEAVLTDHAEDQDELGIRACAEAEAAVAAAWTGDVMESVRLVRESRYRD